MYVDQYKIAILCMSFDMDESWVCELANGKVKERSLMTIGGVVGW